MAMVAILRMEENDSVLDGNRKRRGKEGGCKFSVLVDDFIAAVER